MDLGIRGKRALVCASSKGLGRGCAEALAAEGVHLVMNARSAGPLTQAAFEIAERYGVEVTPVAADITTADGRAKVLDACGALDILVTNAGGPPPGNWRNWTREDFLKAIDANMLTAIALMQATVPGMVDRGWGRVVNITSAAVKSPISVLGLSNTARTGLTGFVAGISRDVAPHGVCINNILPGLHATDRALVLETALAEKEGISITEASARRQSELPTGHYGLASDFGAACAFLCSQQAAFIIGQNLLLDGGAFVSTI